MKHLFLGVSSGILRILTCTLPRAGDNSGTEYYCCTRIWEGAGVRGAAGMPRSEELLLWRRGTVVAESWGETTGEGRGGGVDLGGPNYDCKILRLKRIFYVKTV